MTSDNGVRREMHHNWAEIEVQRGGGLEAAKRGESVIMEIHLRGEIVEKLDLVRDFMESRLGAGVSRAKAIDTCVSYAIKQIEILDEVKDEHILSR